MTRSNIGSQGNGRHSKAKAVLYGLAIIREVRSRETGMQSQASAELEL